MIDANNKPRTVDSIGHLRDWVSEPIPEAVSRNIFEVKLDYFPIDGTKVANGFWDVE